MTTGKVMTALGEIEPEQMGNTPLTTTSIWMRGACASCTRLILDDEAIAIEEAKLFKAAGGGTIRDPTNIGLKRDPGGARPDQHRHPG